MVGRKGFQNPFNGANTKPSGAQSTRVRALIDKQSTLSAVDQFFWRVALDKNCPPSLKGRVEKIKTELTLPEVMQLIEVLEIEAAIEEAFRLDEEASKANTGGKR